MGAVPLSCPAVRYPCAHASPAMPACRSHSARRHCNRAAATLMEEFGSFERLGGGAGFGAEDHERALVKPRWVLRHELCWKVAPDFEIARIVLEPILQCEHQAIRSAAGNKIYPIYSARELPSQAFGALKAG